jgi:excisionase family DNA binding protein
LRTSERIEEADDPVKDTTRPPRAWLTIQEASDLVGVSPATLRRWTEAGDLEAFVTPGGHRRFARTSILGLLPSGVKRHRRLHELGETPERVVRQYRRELASHSAPGGWVQELGDADRETFREPGRRVLAGVLGFLDASTPDASEASLLGALDASARYGAMAREHGIEIDVLTDTFLQFRLPFLHELGRIARRRRLETDEAMDLLLAASRVFDRLLLALLRGYSDLPEPTSATLPEALPVPRLRQRATRRATASTEGSA